MAQIITALLYLYCGSGCKASVVASALTFHPPPPYYKFEAADEDGRDKEGQPLKLEKRRYRLRLSPELPSIPSDVVSRYSCHTIVSNTGTVVPLVLFEQHDAYFTIIVSHGNASDIGSMFIFYAMLRIIDQYQTPPLKAETDLSSPLNATWRPISPIDRNLRLKVNVVGYDYTGYGESMEHEVRPTEEQTYVDVEAVYDWTCDYAGGRLIPSGVPGNHIIVYGQSVGSGPSCYLASGKSARSADEITVGLRRSVLDAGADGDVGGRDGDAGKDTPMVAAPIVDNAGCCCCRGPSVTRKVAGTVLHSPILSGIRVLTSSRYCLACCDIYPNIEFIKTASSPVFVIHGEADAEVRLHHGTGLHERVPEQHRTPPWWVPNRGHNDVLLDNEEEFFLRMKRYLITVRKRQQVRDGDSSGRRSSTESGTTCNGDSGGGGEGDSGLSMVEKLKKRGSKSGTSAMGVLNQTEKDYSEIVITAARKGGGD